VKDKKETLDYILKVWEKFPKMRLGQLLCNAMELNGVKDNGNKLFFQKDDQLIDLLAQYEAFYDAKENPDKVTIMMPAHNHFGEVYRPETCPACAAETVNHDTK
jgi:hypothetical protein